MAVIPRNIQRSMAIQRDLERRMGLSPRTSTVLRDLMDIAAPATGPAGMAAGLLAPPREDIQPLSAIGQPRTEQRKFFRGLADIPTEARPGFDVESELRPLATLGGMVGTTAVPLMLGRPATARQKAFKRLAKETRNPLKGTVVRLPDGQPRPVYHGTNVNFQEFSLRKASSEGLYGKAFYFSESPAVAGGYARGYGGSQSAPQSRPVFLAIFKPFDFKGTTPASVIEKWFPTGSKGEKIIRFAHPSKKVGGMIRNDLLYEAIQEHVGIDKANRFLQRKGFDAITDVGSQGDRRYAVWRREQIVSAFKPGAFTRQLPKPPDLE